MCFSKKVIKLKFKVEKIKEAQKEFDKLSNEQKVLLEEDYKTIKTKGIEFVVTRYLAPKLYEIKTKLEILPPKTIVMMHLEYGKTSKMFKKRRRNFDDIGEILDFKNGNYVVRLLTSLVNEIVDVPQFAIKFLANNYEEFAKNKAIQKTFNL